MKWLNVIILKVNVNKGFPVVISLVANDLVELVPRKIKRRGQIHPGQIRLNISLTFKQQPVPILQRRSRQIKARIFREMRCPHQATKAVIGPAVQRADDMLI